MMESATIAANLQAIQSELPNHVTLVAVSKTKPFELLQAALNAGQVDLGENRVQELVSKAEHFDDQTVRWHHIGHLQTNKVKMVVPHAHLIHAVDSPRLFKEIQKHSASSNRISQVLLQMHIASEEQKFGFTMDELHAFLEEIHRIPSTHVRINGLMGMATFTNDEKQIGREFKALRNTFDELNPGHWDTCSMGMSGDWRIALNEGSTMVRIGSAIFGSR